MEDRVKTKNASNNPINRQTLPKWLIVWWWIAIVSAMPLYLRILWEETWLTWTHGSQNVGWTIMHNHIGFFIFGLVGFLSVFVWILCASIYFIVKKKYPSKNTIFYFIIPLAATALVYMFNDREPSKPNYCYEHIIYSIDTDSIEGISARWRQVNFLSISYKYDDGNELNFYLHKKRNKVYLMYEEEKIRLDKYDTFIFKPAFDSLGLDIAKVKYVYDLMYKYPIRRIAYINKYNVSEISIDSIRFFHIPDTMYLHTPSKKHFERINRNWWIDNGSN